MCEKVQQQLEWPEMVVGSVFPKLLKALRKACDTLRAIILASVCGRNRCGKAD